MRSLLTVCCLTLLSAVAAAADPADSGSEFFERRIRPILVEHCYACHSTASQKQKGGLLLDSRAGLRKGGSSGPAIVPGRPAESLLLQAVQYTRDELRMPPKGKLPETAIADLRQWIALGAPDPRGAGPAASGPRAMDFAAARSHWAYQPVRQPALPPVRNRTWPTSPIDSFILARLEAEGLTPSPLADRRTLLRRVYYDLVGLPPTAEEVEAFVADQAPDALARVVDRLLASPHYGERWGRHWLDVARYADTKDGVLMFGDNRVRPYAYTYRDYVIRALNEDVPYDRFVHEQLAADQIEPPVEPWRLAAMGFLTLGRVFDQNIHDILDDRIDTVTRGLLGLTVACARCHDHKYDAIPTADYYSLYGVFASSEMPIELPLIGEGETSPEAVVFEKQAGPKRQQLRTFLEQQHSQLLETARQRVGDYLVKVATTTPDPLETAIYFLSLAPEDLRPQITARWRRYLERRAQPEDPVFGPWHDLMQLPAEAFTQAAPRVLERWKACGPAQVNPLVQRVLAETPLGSKADVARAYGKLLAQVYEEARKGTPAGDAEVRRPLLEVLTGPDNPISFPRSHTFYYMSRGDKDRFSGLRTELDRLAVQSPHAPPRAMVLVDAEQLHDPRVFVRGNPGQPGDPVPRQFLRVLAGEDRRPFPHGSGRLDLARAITAPDNPLTSRVLVNRVWMHHLGEPLVQTPSDFGMRSSPPSHPELLDYLAWRFQADGWSLKRLHRLIILSSTYQQASHDRPECRQRDPEDRLLWRTHRRRLDLEAMRDTLLAVSGRLERRLGGRPGDASGDPAYRRRTVYGLVDRQSLPGLYRAFDFANPDQSIERRPFTIVPQQALFGLNAPFVAEQARSLAARPEVTGETDGARRIAALYRLVFARPPEPEEVEASLRFVAAAGQAPSQVPAWPQYAQVLLLTNELLFVD